MKQLPLFPSHDPVHLKSYLGKYIRKDVTVVITDNSTVMLSIKNKKDHLSLRLHRMFLSASPDVLDELAGKISAPILEKNSTEPDQTMTDELPPDHAGLLEIMGYDPISIDRLIQLSALTAEEVSSMLLIMELEGRVATLSGGFYQRLNPRD